MYSDYARFGFASPFTRSFSKGPRVLSTQCNLSGTGRTIPKPARGRMASGVGRQSASVRSLTTIRKKRVVDSTVLFRNFRANGITLAKQGQNGVVHNGLGKSTHRAILWGG